MKALFYELIRVSIGYQSSLSYIPNVQEWDKLYKMAEKQALIGICFMGIKNLGADADTGFSKIGMTKMQYLNWMGMAFQIHEQNELRNKQCVKVHELLAKDGYKSCILKGQAVASLYGTLTNLRQSGDIDVCIISPTNEAIKWARKTGVLYFYDYHHADLTLFSDTEVELHYRPSLSRNLIRNKRLQRWFDEEGTNHIIFKEDLGFSVPDYTFNVILTLNHNYWHLLYEGVGMRQHLDLYYVLKSKNKYSYAYSGKADNKEILRLLRYFNLEKYASASMWIMSVIFGLEREYLLCEPDENAGRFLLDEIMLAGNFGKHDERLKDGRYKNRWGLMLTWMRHTFRLFKYYPADVLWTPIGILRISLWRRVRYIREKELK